jgi:hypothetical protein
MSTTITECLFSSVRHPEPVEGPVQSVAAVPDCKVAVALRATGNPERVAIVQPRVGAKRLPWVLFPNVTNPVRVESSGIADRRTGDTSLGDGYLIAPPLGTAAATY